MDLPVVILETEGSLVLRGDTRIPGKGAPPVPPGQFLAATWGLYLVDQGHDATRLVERFRLEYTPTAGQRIYIQALPGCGRLCDGAQDAAGHQAASRRHLLTGCKWRVRRLQKSCNLQTRHLQFRSISHGPSLRNRRPPRPNRRHPLHNRRHRPLHRRALLAAIRAVRARTDRPCGDVHRTGRAMHRIRAGGCDDVRSGGEHLGSAADGQATRHAGRHALRRGLSTGRKGLRRAAGGSDPARCG